MLSREHQKVDVRKRLDYDYNYNCGYKRRLCVDASRNAQLKKPLKHIIIIDSHQGLAQRYNSNNDSPFHPQAHLHWMPYLTFSICLID